MTQLVKAWNSALRTPGLFLTTDGFSVVRAFSKFKVTSAAWDHHRKDNRTFQPVDESQDHRRVVKDSSPPPRVAVAKFSSND